MNNIKEALEDRFQKHRVIFWYDEKAELTEQFAELALASVTKIEIQGNEFEIKHRLTKQQPDAKFLVYAAGKKPTHEENWLLDLELAHHVFQTDKEALYVQELGLAAHLKELVAAHINFFEAKERRQKLNDTLVSDDTPEEIRNKMLAVVFNTNYTNLHTFIHAHGAAFVAGSDRPDKDLERFGLHSFYWGLIEKQFNYQSPTPTLYDFLVEVFAHSLTLEQNTGLRPQAKLVLSLWKDSLQYRDSFAQISQKIASDIDLENKLHDATLNAILQDDLFDLVNKKIIHELARQIAEETITADKVSEYVKIRENKFWYADSAHLYKSLEYGATTVALVRKYAHKTYESIAEGVKDYATTLFEVDLAYRKFIWSFRQAKQNGILTALHDKVAKVYANAWLLQYNNNWQKVVDATTEWPTREINSQQRFFEQHVQPILKKNQRLFVIISDAFRYENGAELTSRLQAENRYEATIQPLLSSLPSYTQLGMAALLPHKELSFQDGSDNVVVDGLSSVGTPARAKILAENSGVRATAIQADEFVSMNAKAGRDYVKQYDLIYIYHNQIDKAGDDKTTEERVFEAVESELTYIIDLLKKIANVNGSHMLITSDHGYIYQHHELDESDFCKSAHSGSIWKENRRFVIGENLVNDNATKKFRASELNIASDADVLLPKSINRLRVKGAGSRFVHGGAAMQEIVIPLIKVVKKKHDTTSLVDIDIIKASDKITTNILTLRFIQTNLVSTQVLPRTLRAGIYAEDGELLSDLFTYNFDIDTGTERQREVTHTFQLMAKASGKYKNQRVKLLLEEPVDGTTKWKEYKEFSYTLNISFTNDFDDF